VYLSVDPGFYPLPLNVLNLFFFKLKHRGLFPHTMDARDRHNGQRDERTDGRTNRRFASFRPSVRLLDGVWHLSHKRLAINTTSKVT